jgi:hypothetical protein
MPYSMRRSEFIHLAETYPCPQYEPLIPANYSEESLHAATLENRQREQIPPFVKNFPLGSWTKNSLDSLYLLQEIPIRKIRIREITDSITVHKYISWYQAGSPFPPVYVVEGIDHDLHLTDGHHRIQAQLALGIQTVKAWLSLSLYRQLDNGCIWADDLSYPAITLLAMRLGIQVRATVLKDAMKDYLNGLDRIDQMQSIELKLSGHEGIISATQIETLRRWKVIQASYQSGYYQIHTTEFGKQVLRKLVF